MLHEEKKITKIVEELTIFFIGIGGNDITSRINIVDNETTIIFKSNYDKRYENKVDIMEEFLKKQRNEGVEDIFWELAGTGEPGETSQLLLLGMMVGDVNVTKDGDYVRVELKKDLY